ncbi:MAG: hypothetical protein H6728_00730 [Myxococcales bacterium]|nr:hypothetical protein [Myxococcales bacterium]
MEKHAQKIGFGLLAGLLLVGCQDSAVRHPSRDTQALKRAPPKRDAVTPKRRREGVMRGGHTLSTTSIQQHIEAKKASWPQGFTYVIEPPFVVLGDDTPERVRAYAKGTVRWAVQHLKKLYFQKDPNQVLEVWLFKDRASYQKHTYALFGHRPDTPYGYYSSDKRALVMNIATGGGTLVHEIVHPFMESNFPHVPDWFNEGLGSLYEQSAERGGQIVGLTNWRLAGLQEAIQKKTLPPFAKMMGTKNNDFYDKDPGTNYAQARYLCYFLQEKGLLVRYYQSFFQQQAQDPTGYKTLQQLLQTKDMKAFQADWEKWVLTLRFP